MKKLFVAMLLGLFLVSFASAGYSSYDYSHPDEVVVRKTITLTGDRFPTYDYRHGYSYRTTDAYKDSRYSDSVIRFSNSGGYHTDYDYARSTKTGVYYRQGSDYRGSPIDLAEYSYDYKKSGSSYRDSYLRPTKDYGYSYGDRPSIRLNVDHDYSARGYRNYEWDYSSDDRYRFNRGDVYYQYVSHLRTYEPKTCYRSTDHNNLFYRKCPDY